MRYCQSCGKEQDDDAVFCGNCGAKLDPIDADVEESTQEHSEEELASEKEAEQESAGTDGVSSAADNVSVESASVGETTDTTNRSSETTSIVRQAQQIVSDTKGKGLSRNRLIGIIVAAIIVVVVVVIILVVALGGNGGPSDEQVKTDIENQYKDKGIVPSNYVTDPSEDPYSIEITHTDQNPVQTNSELSVRKVDFEGTMKNESFETRFGGHAYYINDSGSWTLASNYYPADENDYLGFKKLVSEISDIYGITKDFSTTTPLKGVDMFEKSLSSTASDLYTLGDFDSSLDESNSSYTSIATQDITYDFWFATDTGTNTQTFEFSEENGWQPKDKVDTSNRNTEWKLAGKTFDLSSNVSLMWSNGTVDSSLTFTEFGGNKVVADYTINYVPASDDNNKNYGTFNEIHLNGSASNTATIKHDFGSENFSFEINDSGQEVTFTCSQGKDTTVAGSGTVNSLSVSLKTVSNYRTYTFVGTTHEYPLEFSGTYTERSSDAS